MKLMKRGKQKIELWKWVIHSDSELLSRLSSWLDSRNDVPGQINPSLGAKKIQITCQVQSDYLK